MVKIFVVYGEFGRIYATKAKTAEEAIETIFSKFGGNQLKKNWIAVCIEDELQKDNFRILKWS